MNATHRIKAVAATALTAVAAAVTALADVSAHAATPAAAPVATTASADASNGPKTRAQVMAEFYEARRLGLLDNGGDAGPSEQVLERREAYNAAQAEQLMAQQRAAQTAAAQPPADSLVIVTNGTGQRIVAPAGSVLVVTPADTDPNAGPPLPAWPATQDLSPRPGAAAPEIQADEVIVVDVPQAPPARPERPKAERERAPVQRPPVQRPPTAPAPDNHRDPAETPKDKPLPRPVDQLASQPVAPTGREIPAIIIMEGADPQALTSAPPAR